MAERDRREETRDTRLDALSRFFRVLRSAHIASGDNGLKKEDLIAAFQTQLSQPLVRRGQWMGKGHRYRTYLYIYHNYGKG